MDLQYRFANHMAELYERLADALSKKMFLARVAFDTSYSIDSMLQLWGLSGVLTEDEAAEQLNWRRAFDNLNRNKQKIILYGAGCCGRLVGKALLQNHSDFFGYCDRNAADFQDGLLGKPVIPPRYLFEHANECYVILATMDYPLEIYHYLLTNHFPEDHILPYFGKPGASYDSLIASMYFEFPELYPKGKAFVDGGCFHCETSARFAEWCSGAYSKIIAFEPDQENYQYCQKLLAEHPVERLELLRAGLSDHAVTAVFAESDYSGSCIMEAESDRANLMESVLTQKNVYEIKTVALDDVVKDCEVGFIKLDIEGAEYAALQGAKQTLLRDKPFLAICVYHRRGDLLAIMDYLHGLIPEYRFWLRHYSFVGCDTVLYASV